MPGVAQVQNQVRREKTIPFRDGFQRYWHRAGDTCSDDGKVNAFGLFPSEPFSEMLDALVASQEHFTNQLTKPLLPQFVTQILHGCNHDVHICLWHFQLHILSLQPSIQKGTMGMGHGFAHQQIGNGFVKVSHCDGAIEIQTDQRTRSIHHAPCGPCGFGAAAARRWEWVCHRGEVWWGAGLSCFHIFFIVIHERLVTCDDMWWHALWGIELVLVCSSWGHGHHKAHRNSRVVGVAGAIGLWPAIASYCCHKSWAPWPKMASLSEAEFMGRVQGAGESRDFLLFIIQVIQHRSQMDPNLATQRPSFSCVFCLDPARREAKWHAKTFDALLLLGAYKTRSILVTYIILSYIWLSINMYLWKREMVI